MAKKKQPETTGPFTEADAGRTLVLGDGTAATITDVRANGRIDVRTDAGRTIQNLGLGSVRSLGPLPSAQRGPRKARRYRALDLGDPWPLRKRNGERAADVIVSEPDYVRWCRENVGLELSDKAFSLLEQQP